MNATGKNDNGQKRSARAQEEPEEETDADVDGELMHAGRGGGRQGGAKEQGERVKQADGACGRAGGKLGCWLGLVKLAGCKAQLSY